MKVSVIVFLVSILILSAFFRHVHHREGIYVPVLRSTSEERITNATELLQGDSNISIWRVANFIADVETTAKDKELEFKQRELEFKFTISWEKSSNIYFLKIKDYASISKPSCLAKQMMNSNVLECMTSFFTRRYLMYLRNLIDTLISRLILSLVGYFEGHWMYLLRWIFPSTPFQVLPLSKDIPIDHELLRFASSSPLLYPSLLEVPAFSNFRPRIPSVVQSLECRIPFVWTQVPFAWTQVPFVWTQVPYLSLSFLHQRWSLQLFKSKYYCLLVTIQSRS
jgi:hypothetical protein